MKEPWKLRPNINTLLLSGLFVVVLPFQERVSAADRTDTERLAATAVTNLSGTWEITPEGLPTTIIKVPGFYVTQKVTGRFVIDEDGPDNLWRIFEDARHAVYERTFDVGVNMAGQHIFLRFEAVNFGCNISVNGTPVLTHYGGFMPFEIDISDYITVPSANNTLSVEIIGNDNQLFFQGYEDYPLWPVGFYGHHMNNGITGEVYLLSRPDLYVEDVFITTSVDNMVLSATVSVHNIGETSVSGSCRLNVTDPARSIGTQFFSIAPDSTEELTFEYSWPDAELWSPADPKLYEIKASLIRNNFEINSKTISFGFRQFKQQGTDFFLNGRRITLLGDNIVLHGEKRYWQYLVPDENNWTAAVDSMLSLNCNVIRLHQEPPPSWMIDICDEKGMLVIAESAIYAAVADRQEEFVENARTWQKQWVKRDRNHPSIVLWSASNEMFFPSRHFLADQIYRFGTAVTEMDSSRPIFFEGDFDIAGLANIGSYHYIYGFPNGGIPAAGLYDINTYRYDDIPSSHGEFEWSRGLIPESKRVRIQCLKSRAMRVGRWADIRPYRLDWAWHPDPGLFINDYGGWFPTQDEIEFLKDSFNPIAAFDSSYYEFAVFPIVPSFNESDEISRHIYIFNNEGTDAPITLTWETVLDGNVVKTDSLNVYAPPGGMAEADITFKAPIIAEDKRFQLRLNTYKEGHLRFSEDYQYNSLENGIWEPAAPRAPKALQITCSQDTIHLSWNDVTADINDKPTTVASYRIFQSSNIGFNPAGTDSFTVTGITSSISRDFSSPCEFYRVIGIDGDGRRSGPSDTAGYLTYELRASAGTDYNSVGVPFNDVAGSAAALHSRIALCTSVASWSAAYQGFSQYIPEISGSNFTLSSGGPVLVNIPGDTSWTASGIVSRLNYSLIYQSGTTNIHFITLPFSKYELTKASHLLADIPNCESVSCWNPANQNYLQYIPGYSLSDFAIVPGHAYFVDINASVTWPGEGLAKPLPPLLPKSSLPALPGPPHLAVVPVNKFFEQYETIRAVARLGDDSTSTREWTLHREAAEDTVLLIQCAEFPGGWHPADTLQVTFFDRKGTPAGHARGSLSNRAYDLLTPALAAQAAPVHTGPAFTLAQNYPNPFNAGTSITYHVSKKSRITVIIYNLNGRRIRVLADQDQEPGNYTLYWNGKDARGIETSSGTYLCRITSDDAQQTIRMINLK